MSMMKRLCEENHLATRTPPWTLLGELAALPSNPQPRCWPFEPLASALRVSPLTQNWRPGLSQHYGLDPPTGPFTLQFKKFSASLCITSRVRFVQDSICAAFNASRYYADTFEVFLRFYRENDSLDLKKVAKEEHGKRCRLCKATRLLLEVPPTTLATFSTMIANA